MIVECANSVRYLVLGCKLLNLDGYSNRSDYNDDLTSEDAGFDIMKVYMPSDYYQGNLRQVFTDYNLTLIWERAEKRTVELTLEDIAEKFNVSVSQIKIKK